jgi:hypothetical protein
MMKTNAAAIDYDDWDTPGWTFDDLLPLVKKVSSCLSLRSMIRGPNVLNLLNDRVRLMIRQTLIVPSMETRDLFIFRLEVIRVILEMNS